MKVTKLFLFLGDNILMIYFFLLQDKKGQLNKKIIFSDNEDGSNEEKNNEEIKIIRSNDKELHKKRLFDEESDNDEAIFKVNQQFEGVKGQKVNSIFISS